MIEVEVTIYDADTLDETVTLEYFESDCEAFTFLEDVERLKMKLAFLTADLGDFKLSDLLKNPDAVYANTPVTYVNPETGKAESTGDPMPTPFPEKRESYYRAMDANTLTHTVKIAHI